MSRTRQAEPVDVRTASVIFTTRNTWRRGGGEWGELIFTSRGMMKVHTGAGLWVLSAQHALWTPPGVPHDVEAAAHTPLRTVYLSPELSRRLPGQCFVVQVSPLLRELLRSFMRLDTLSLAERAEANLVEVFLDQLASLPLEPIDLPSPRDPRAIRAAAIVRAGPAERRPLAEIARASGASARTLERLFRQDTGLPFGAWRQRAGLVAGLEALAAGEPVTGAAAAAGYDSVSAFVAAFRRTLGTTPGRWFKAREAMEEG